MHQYRIEISRFPLNDPFSCSYRLHSNTFMSNVRNTRVLNISYIVKLFTNFINVILLFGLMCTFQLLQTANIIVRILSCTSVHNCFVRGSFSRDAQR